MVETRDMDDLEDGGYMYGNDNDEFGYIQDTDILDRPDLFYGESGQFSLF